MDSSSHMVFVAGSSNNSRSSSTAQGKSWKPCFNFVKGNYQFGDSCRYVHDANACVPNATGSLSPTAPTGPSAPLEFPMPAQVPLHYTARPVQSVPAHASLTSGFSVMGLAQTPQSVPNTAIPNPGQAIVLPHAFAARTLQDPSASAWNMDTSATSHLNNSITSLSTVLNSFFLLRISQSDEFSFDVIAPGISILSCFLLPSRMLSLEASHSLSCLSAWCEIHAFQCDHDGEFNNCKLHDLFNTHGISVTRDSSRMFLSQKKYAVEILERAGMVNCNPNQNPIDRVKDPIFPNLIYSPPLLQAWLLIQMQIGLAVLLLDDRLQGVSNAVAETCWLWNLLRELHTPLSSATLVYFDNISFVYMSSNLVQH
ncbi:ribonuclease H-like domain-containing protein [Tanacetum coccineum]|uniref:Ribonuclease H-like domain-containing protein n=1 Tax=Tanacetum coccineum TaxID=301880 RepID=A0ABQ5HIX6_9ASTR